MRVTRLQESNFKRVTSVDIAPGDKALVVLRGPNEAGKTSVLDGLIAALGGKKLAPDVPINKQADSAVVTVEVVGRDGKKYRITRSWNQSNTYLHVYQIDEDGTAAKITAGQTFLDQLVSDVAFDPLAFSRAKPAEQQRLLLVAAGLAEQYNKLMAKRAAVYDERAGLNQTAKQLAAELNTHPDPAPNIELQPVSDAELAGKFQEAQQHNAAGERITHNISATKANIVNLQAKAKETSDKIAELKIQLVATENGIQDNTKELQNLEAKQASFQPIDSATIQEQIAKAHEHNNRVRAQKAARELTEKAVAIKQRIEQAIGRIEAIDREAETLLNGSDLGKSVPGLAISEGQITHNGVPFAQASGMRKLELSCLVGMAANPKLRIMVIDEADRLDDESVKRLVELAKERDFSVWMTAVRMQNESVGDDMLVCDVSDGVAKAGDVPSESLAPNSNPQETVAVPEDFEL